MKTLKIVAMLILLLLLLLSGVHPELRSFLTRESLLNALRDAGPWAPVLHMLAMASAIVISPIPTVPLDVVGGVLFGPWLGTLYSSLGALLGAVIAFLIARRIGRGALESLLDREVCICPDCSNRAFLMVVFLSRLLPIVSFDFISYGAGLTRMPVSGFALATFVGMLPLTYVYTVFGAQLFTNPLIASVIGAFLAIAFLSLPWLVRKYNLLGLQKYFFVSERGAKRDQSND